MTVTAGLVGGWKVHASAAFNDSIGICCCSIMMSKLRLEMGCLLRVLGGRQEEGQSEGGQRLFELWFQM